MQNLSDPEFFSDCSFSDKTAEENGEKSKEKFESLIKRKEFLEKILDKEKEIKNIKNKIEENKTILNSDQDRELASLAETELLQLTENKKKLEKELENLLAEKDNSSFSSFDGEKKEEKKISGAVVVEIRAGAGGEEAALFAFDLFRMYSKYADLKNWKRKVLDCQYSDLGGIKQIIFELKGNNVSSEMQKEAGVHRVQRIPTTEKSGRIHTSTASIAVLLKPKKGKISVNQSDLKVYTCKASGPGGQYVNKRMTAIRIVHLPTGLTVASQTERSLQQNRENALSILEARLLEKKEEEEYAKTGQKRRLQIGKAQRAEKIRTYNFPQNRITDHRIKKSFHNLEEIMEGKMEPIVKAMQKIPFQEK